MANPATKSTALWVVKRLRRAGYQALLAGGCVRDMLLGLRCTDYDVATNASPQEVKALFHRVLLIGAKFGVAMVIHHNRMVEVTTFRSDLSYTDGRRPDGVEFATQRQDARRRDFTINGMYYDPIAGTVIDYVGGREDLRRRVVRTIGPADRRLAEDYLRMIRAVRFAVRLGFSLDRKIAAAIRKHAEKIASISGERIYDELSKMLVLDSAAKALDMLADLGLAQAVLGELFSHPAENLWDRARGRVAAVVCAKGHDLILALAALLGDLPPRTISQIVRRWGGSNSLKETLQWLAGHRSDWNVAAQWPLCDFKRMLVSDHFARLRVLWRLEERCAAHGDTQGRRIARRVRSIPKDRIAPVPLVTGEDLKKLGLSEGRKLGLIVRKLYDAQLNEEFASRREALAAARRLVKETPR